MEKQKRIRRLNVSKYQARGMVTIPEFTQNYISVTVVFTNFGDVFKRGSQWGQACGVKHPKN